MSELVVYSHISRDILSITKSVFVALVGPWLDELYLRGPSFYKLGFWEGKSYQQICSDVSDGMIHESFWDNGNMQYCVSIVKRKIEAFYITSFIFVVFCILIFTFVKF